MEGILKHKGYNRWVVMYTECKPKSIVTEYNKEIPVDTNSLSEIKYDDGKKVNFEILEYWETDLEIGKYAKLIPEKIKFEKISEEQLEKERNPAYKYFDIEEISDEEIDKAAIKYDNKAILDTPWFHFMEGAKWMREQIKKRK